MTKFLIESNKVQRLGRKCLTSKSDPTKLIQKACIRYFLAPKYYVIIAQFCFQVLYSAIPNLINLGSRKVSEKATYFKFSLAIVSFPSQPLHPYVTDQPK